MLTIHHLGVSQSDRVVWLMEELGLHYELKWYNRGEDFLAPAEFRALHPLGTAPIITDGDLVMAESTAIVEYISQRYGEGKLSVAVEDQDYPNYLYWMNFNNNFQSVLFMKMAYQAGGGDLAAEGQIVDVMLRREQGLYDYLEQRLGESEYLGAARFSCADIMAMFNLTSLEMLGARPVDESLPNTKAYVERICARPAYKKAMSIVGPAATPPA
ncbi:glutathione S-transferase [Halioglobus sp. HI00S01]|uniref:glutathione S-transferase family protein n=1 Tax=Halioglobus sp. HI00S01 TaxID=1822214 RepID=UPI0007C39ACB|nr:glutathione S-transferase [Halioglobus sp. HI00S01]KZX58279.1 glutathione S-transferase [Halioglobus sp. HI00S01]